MRLTFTYLYWNDRLLEARCGPELELFLFRIQAFYNFHLHNSQKYKLSIAPYIYGQENKESWFQSFNKMNNSTTRLERSKSGKDLDGNKGATERT